MKKIQFLALLLILTSLASVLAPAKVNAVVGDFYFSATPQTINMKAGTTAVISINIVNGIISFPSGPSCGLFSAFTSPSNSLISFSLPSPSVCIATTQSGVLVLYITALVPGGPGTLTPPGSYPFILTAGLCSDSPCTGFSPSHTTSITVNVFKADSLFVPNPVTMIDEATVQGKGEFQVSNQPFNTLYPTVGLRDTVVITMNGRFGPLNPNSQYQFVAVCDGGPIDPCTIHTPSPPSLPPCPNSPAPNTRCYFVDLGTFTTDSSGFFASRMDSSGNSLTVRGASVGPGEEKYLPTPSRSCIFCSPLPAGDYSWHVELLCQGQSCNSGPCGQTPNCHVHESDPLCFAGLDCPLDVSFTVPFPVLGTWRSVGPSPVRCSDSGGPPACSGRVTALAFDPSHPGTMYLGGALGGVWKSTDYGQSWTAKSDDQPSLAIGAIAVDSSGAVYAGTGEGSYAPDSYYGGGVLKSTDGGNTWVQLGVSTFGRSAVTKIVIDSTNPNHIIAATTSSVRTDSSTASSPVSAGVLTGVLLSSDGGLTWTVSRIAFSGTGASDVVQDPVNPTIFYAAVDGQVWKSINGGSSFPSSLNAQLTQAQLGNGRISLAIAPGLILAFTGGCYLFKYDGSTWSPPISNVGPLDCAGVTGYAMFIAIDPTDSKIFYLGSLGVFRSNDGGSNWGYMPGTKSDEHAFAFDPASHSGLFVGEDGGVFYSSAADTCLVQTATFNPPPPFCFAPRNSGLDLTQFYSLAASPTNLNVYFGGTQDLGVPVHTGSLTWDQFHGQDGGWVGFDPTNSQHLYYSAGGFGAGNQLSRSLDGGSTKTDISPSNAACLGFAPFAIDPSNPSIMYSAGCVIAKTTHALDDPPPGSPRWTIPSPGLDTATGPTGSGSSWTCTPNCGQPTAITVSSDGKLVYVGTLGGRFFVSANGGMNFVEADNGLPTRVITKIALDPSNPARVITTLSCIWGAGSCFNGQHVFLTTTKGSQWTDITSNLPDFPADSVALSPNTILVGTDIGVYVSTDDGSSWQRVGVGLPNVAVYDLVFTANGSLLAATHGRGVWALPPERATSTTIGKELNAPANFCLCSLLLPSQGVAGIGAPVAYVAEVEDIDTGSPGFPVTPGPLGTVSWNDNGAGGTFSPAASCSLMEEADNPGFSACGMTYTPPLSIGLVAINARYSGDDVHKPSLGDAGLDVISVNISGTISSRVSTDNSRNIIITLLDPNGNALAQITYPPGTRFSSGTLTGDFRTANGITMVKVSGATLRPGTTKTVSIRPPPGANTLCVVDSPTPAAQPDCSGTNTSIDTVVFVTVAAQPPTTYPCDGSRIIFDRFPPGEPSPRMYGCSAPTPLFRFYQITGLTFSLVQSIANRVQVSQFFTDSGLTPLPTDSNGSPKSDVVLGNGVVVSTNPGRVLAWVNVTNSGGAPLQSLKVNETLPVDWTVGPAWGPSAGAIHVFFANTTSLSTNPDITQRSTIEVSTANPEVVQLAIPNFTATAIGHLLMPGQSILLSVKLVYGLIGTSQSAVSYPRNYVDTTGATGWSMPNYTGIETSSTASGFLIADAKVVS